MPATVAGIHLGPDTHANRPAADASGLPVGSLYSCSDHSLIYQTDGSAWSTWATLGGDVSAHTGDTSDAHDASAISVLDTAANFTGTDVEAVLAELQDNIDAGGGGGATREYLGTTSLGGSTEVMPGNKVFMKQITPANACDLLSVQFGLDPVGGGQLTSFGAGLWTDSSGSPGILLAVHNMLGDNGVYPNTTDRWLSFSLNYELSASTAYWIGVMSREANEMSILYAASGSDKTLVGSFGGLVDWSLGTQATTTRDYSIRARVVR